MINHLRPIMVVGTHSGVGKHHICLGVCSKLYSNGISVAPFKGYHIEKIYCSISKNDKIAISQAIQAVACRTTTTPFMSPIVEILNSREKIILGKKYKSTFDFSHDCAKLCIKYSINELHDCYDTLCIEGGGSPSEISLHDIDLPNIYVARYVKPRIIIVGDADRGGVFAHIKGTIDLMPDDIQQLVIGYIINKSNVLYEKDRFLSAACSLADLIKVPLLGVVPDLGYNRIINESERGNSSIKKISNNAGNIITISNLIAQHIDIP